MSAHLINCSPPPPLVLVCPLAAATVGPGRCDTIYQGFAKCLIRLGDGMGSGGELETVCRYGQVQGLQPNSLSL